MAHIKKSEMPKTWPIPRKGKKKRYVAVPSHATKKGISLLFLLRDILHLAATRREARYMTLNGMVKVNNKVRHDENFPVQVLDTLNLEKSGKNYRLQIKNKKFTLIEIDAKAAEEKIVKISGKKVVSGNKIQMNLDDGQNILATQKFSVGDSALFNTKTNKITKIIHLKVGAKVEIVSGKHAGEKGEIIDFVDLTRGRDYKIKIDKTEVNLPFKAILVME